MFDSITLNRWIEASSGSRGEEVGGDLYQPRFIPHYKLDEAVEKRRFK